MSEQVEFKRWVYCAACGGAFAVFGYAAYEGEVQERHVCKDLMVEIAPCIPHSDIPLYPVPQRPASVEIAVTTSGSTSAYPFVSFPAQPSS